MLTTITDGEIQPGRLSLRRRRLYQLRNERIRLQYVFVPLKHLQQLRTMDDRATSIQIRLKDYDTGRQGRQRAAAGRCSALEAIQVSTWEDKQGPLLAAIAVEKGILNVLLFMIIAVAGFGILAIFSMIVVEKTRDIGILKALGASNGGVLKIFLGYGLLLGLVGAGAGHGPRRDDHDVHQPDRARPGLTHRPGHLRPQTSTISTRSRPTSSR